MADSFEQLREEFLEETEDTLQQLQRDLNELGQTIENGTVPPDNVLDRAFRTTHSLKGVAGMFGLPLMSSVAHAMEAVFESIRGGGVSLDGNLADVLYRGNEALHALLAAGTAGEERTESRIANEALEALERAHVKRRPETPDSLTVPGAIDRLDAAERDAVMAAELAGRRIVAVEATLPAEGFEEPFREYLAAIRNWGTVHGSVSSDPHEGFFRVQIVASGLDEVFPLMKAVGHLGGEVLLGSDGHFGHQETAATSSDPGAPGTDLPHDRVVAARPGGSLRVPVERVDRLLIRLGDLIQAKMGLDDVAAELLDATGSASPTMLRQSLRGLDRHIRALQDGILGVRLVSLGPLFQKLERTFREVCRVTGKEARLVTEGEDLEMDKRVVDAIAEPLIHLVRNAVDHGLEDGDTREARGKARQGTVRIAAIAAGSHTLVEVFDDGGGIDHERVLARGRERGLVAPGATPTATEIRDLLFRTGFTMKDGATEISGRGVGLDAVRESMTRVGGSIEIQPDEVGTRFHLRVPVTLAVMQALEIVDGGRSYFVPLSHVGRALRLETQDVDVVQTDGRVYLDGSEAIPVHELGGLLEPGAPRRRDTVRAAILLVEGSRRLVIPVDRVGRRREIVVRSLGPLLPAIPGVSGCTELGDGRTVLILDPIALFDVAGRNLAGQRA